MAGNHWQALKKACRTCALYSRCSRSRLQMPGQGTRRIVLDLAGSLCRAADTVSLVHGTSSRACLACKVVVVWLHTSSMQRQTGKNDTKVMSPRRSRPPFMVPLPPAISTCRGTALRGLRTIKTQNGARGGHRDYTAARCWTRPAARVVLYTMFPGAKNIPTLLQTAPCPAHLIKHKTRRPPWAYVHSTTHPSSPVSPVISFSPAPSPAIPTARSRSHPLVGSQPTNRVAASACRRSMRTQSWVCLERVIRGQGSAYETRRPGMPLSPPAA